MRPTARVTTGRRRHPAAGARAERSPCAPAGGCRATASARKSGKIPTPKRGIESSGQSLAGTESGIARLQAANRPYGAPKRRHAITVSADEQDEEGEVLEVDRRRPDRVGARRRDRASSRRACASRTPAARTPAQPARSPSQIPPSGPAGERCRCQSSCECRKAQVSPVCCQSSSGIGGEDRRRDERATRAPAAAAATPGEQHERGQQRDRRPAA